MWGAQNSVCWVVVWLRGQPHTRSCYCTEATTMLVKLKSTQNQAVSLHRHLRWMFYLPHSVPWPWWRPSEVIRLPRHGFKMLTLTVYKWDCLCYKLGALQAWCNQRCFVSCVLGGVGSSVLGAGPMPETKSQDISASATLDCLWSFFLKSIFNLSPSLWKCNTNFNRSTRRTLSHSKSCSQSSRCIQHKPEHMTPVLLQKHLW